MLNPFVFLQPKRLFLMQPARLSTQGLIVCLIIFGLLLLGAGVFWWLRKNKKEDVFLDKLYVRMISLGLSGGISGIILVLLRQGQVYFFGARFWFLLWLIVFGLWMGYNVRFYKKIIPQKRETKEAEELFGKYLPKKKK